VLVIFGWVLVPVACLIGERAQKLLHQFSLGHVDECDHYAVDLIIHCQAFSAGRYPRGRVHPDTFDLLHQLHFDVSGLRSKSWTEFSASHAPQLDFVFTVCDNAAGETCPVWPGQPMTAHWGIPDPAEAKRTPAEIALAFKDVYRMLNQRIGFSRRCPSATSIGSACNNGSRNSATSKIRTNGLCHHFWGSDGADCPKRSLGSGPGQLISAMHERSASGPSLCVRRYTILCSPRGTKGAPSPVRRHRYAVRAETR
jgi:protein-tyrosine-phosphatase